MTTKAFQKTSLLLSAILFFSILNSFSLVRAVEITEGAPAIITGINKCDFRSDFRKLWEDHITWTRLYIVDATSNSPETNATTQRLLENQVDIGNAIKPFYGTAAGNQLTLLLKSHILIAANIISAAKAGDTAKVELDSKKWIENADAISSFLNKANPKNWPLADLKDMMHRHLTFTTNEVVAHLQKKWTEDIGAYESIHKEILEMSDALAQGIINQFPDRFAQ